VTTATWVRGILADDYGLNIERTQWVTFEDPHVAEYRDPPSVERAAPGKDLTKMLLDGEIDAAILGDVAAEPPLAHLIPDHAAEAQRWARIHGGVPINHMAAIRRSIAESRPDVVREVYRLLVESRATASLPEGLDDPLRVGVRATRDSVERMIEYSFQQQLISRRPAVDEVYGEAVRVLGPAAD
jgi:4,5-dihydroxyphthalate decarboxylase